MALVRMLCAVVDCSFRWKPVLLREKPWRVMISWTVHITPFFPARTVSAHSGHTTIIRVHAHASAHTQKASPPTYRCLGGSLKGLSLDHDFTLICTGNFICHSRDKQSLFSLLLPRLFLLFLLSFLLWLEKGPSLINQSGCLMTGVQHGNKMNSA